MMMMPVSPLVVIFLSLPVAAAITLFLVKKRPHLTSRRIRLLAALSATGILLIYLIAIGGFSGDPDDWEGLTYVLRPVAAIFLLGLQFLMGGLAAWLVLRRQRPQRGYIE